MRLHERRLSAPAATLLFFPCTCFVLGCASPGAPRPPSLQLPAPVTDLSAERSGNTVLLRFSVPSRTTDDLPLHPGPLEGSLCRQTSPGGPCDKVMPTASGAPLVVASNHHRESTAVWTDVLPADLASGAPRALVYRVEIRNGKQKSAGDSAPVYAPGGAAPSAVQHLRAEGTRPGVLLRWAPDAGIAGEVLLQRTQLDPPPSFQRPRGSHPEPLASAHKGSSAGNTQANNGVAWLQADPGNKSATETMDGTVAEGVRYSYLAVRRVTVHVGAHTLELRSAPSAAVEVTWRDIYPPAAPKGLTAIGFAVPPVTPQATGSYAVDLIWQPVQDARVTGYVVSRVPLAPDGTVQGAAQRLSASPVITPSFHDSTAQPDQGYRYLVTTVDAKGNSSSPAETTVQVAAP